MYREKYFKFFFRTLTIPLEIIPVTVITPRPPSDSKLCHLQIRPTQFHFSLFRNRRSYGIPGGYCSHQLPIKPSSATRGFRENIVDREAEMRSHGHLEVCDVKFLKLKEEKKNKKRKRRRGERRLNGHVGCSRSEQNH